MSNKLVRTKSSVLSRDVADPALLEARARAIESYRSSLWEGPSRLTTLVSLRKIVSVHWKELIIEEPCVDRMEREARRWKQLETYPWERLRATDINTIRDVLHGLPGRKGKSAPGSVNKHLFSLRGLLQHFVLVRLISKDDFNEIQKTKAAKGSRLNDGRVIDGEEVRKLLASCNLSTNRGLRDFAVISVLHGAGIRRDEVGTMTLSGYDPHGDPPIIRVIGKGNKEREIPIQPDTVVAIDRWLDRARGRAPGILFPRISQGRGNKIRYTTRLSSQAVFRVLKDLIVKSGIKPCMPHDFRRTWITQLHRAGVPTSEIQKMAGHARHETTLGYLQRDPDMLRRAADALTTYRAKKG